MSKRFGRNQKRKLKHENQQLFNKLTTSKNKIRELSNDYDELLFVINDIRESFGSNSAFLEPSKQLALKQPLHKWYSRSTASYNDIEKQQCMMELMYNLSLDVKHNPDKYDGMFHFNFFLDQGNREVSRAGYAMSEKMLKYMDFNQLERRIGREVAKLIINGFRGNK